MVFAKKPEFDRKNGGVVWDKDLMKNFMLLRPALASVVFCGLAACGGGGGTDTPATVEPEVPAPTVPDDTSTLGQRAAALDLIAQWAPTNPPVYTALSAVPLTGRAEYNGFIYGSLSNSNDDITDSIIGSLALEVGFNAGGATFSGTAGEFTAEDDTGLTGNLVVSGGSLNRAGNPAGDATAQINLGGTLTDAADHDLVFSNVALEGDFLGSAHNAIGGAALGGVTVDGVSQDFDGGFIAER